MTCLIAAATNGFALVAGGCFGGLQLEEIKAKSGDAAALCLVGGGNEIREQLAELGAARRARRAEDALID